MNHKISIA